jgi:hypothetical protein
VTGKFVLFITSLKTPNGYIYEIDVLILAMSRICVIFARSSRLWYRLDDHPQDWLSLAKLWRWLSIVGLLPLKFLA